MSKRRLSINEYAENIKTTMPPMVIHEPSEQLYSYNGKYYEPLTEFYMKRYIANFFLIEGYPDNWSPSLSQQVAEGIKMSPQIEVVQEFDTDRNLINLNNGVYNIKTKEFSKHKQEYLFTTILNIDYDPGQTEAPNFMEFLDTTFTSTSTYNEPDYEAINAVLQLGGYALYPQNTIEGFFMFMGSGSNGKSLLIDILSSFFPPKFVTDMSLRLLSKESSFEREPILQSRLNVSGEEKGKPMDAEQIKKISSGQAIMVARKFKPPIRFKPNTLLLMDSNTIPQFRDHTHGTMRRMLFFKFKNTFVPKEIYDSKTEEERARERLFPLKDRSTFLPDILKERSAIFNMFIDALRELQSNNWQFPRTENAKEMLEEYNRETDTLGTWLRENYIVPLEKDIPNLQPIPITQILNDFQEYYAINFPGTRFSYSSKGVSTQIRNIFKARRAIKGVKIGESWTTISAYYLLSKNKDPWENINIRGEENSSKSLETPSLL